MSSIEYTLDMAANIKGAFAVAIVDYDSGMTLGSRGGSPEFDLDVAAPGNSDVVRTKLEVMQKLGLRETIEDILITLDSQYHLIRPIHGNNDEKLFFWLGGLLFVVGSVAICFMFQAIRASSVEWKPRSLPLAISPGSEAWSHVR